MFLTLQNLTIKIYKVTEHDIIFRRLNKAGNEIGGFVTTRQSKLSYQLKKYCHGVRAQKYDDKKHKILWK